jgi:hypothetical protein
MTEEEWGRPAEVGGEFARPADLNGHLLIVYPLGYVENIQTQFGPSDGICVDVVDLDDKDDRGRPGKVYRASNFMQGQLIASLKNQIGSKILGVMGQGQGKPGRNRPWIIVDMSGDPGCRDRAAAWKSENPNFRPSPFVPRDTREPQGHPTVPEPPRQTQSAPYVAPVVQTPTQYGQAAPLRAPVAGSPTLDAEEASLVEQFRQRRAAAQQQASFTDEAPF